LYALLWLALDRGLFDWNSVATLAVWIMTLFIQHANRRDTLALHAKLDEQEPETIQHHRDRELQSDSPRSHDHARAGS
jgi:low affinity Fe/Cu permease